MSQTTRHNRWCSRWYVQFVKYLVQADPDVIGIMGTIANKRERTRWGFGSRAQRYGTQRCTSDYETAGYFRFHYFHSGLPI